MAAVSTLRRRALLITGILTAVVGLAATPAAADIIHLPSSGDLFFAQAISADNPDVDNIGPVNPLALATSSAVSPDGDSVYVVSQQWNLPAVHPALSHFRRGSDNSLSYAGCIGPAGCTPLPAGLVEDGYDDVAALNDRVYAGAYGRLMAFVRVPGGDLAYLSCFSMFDSDPCVRVPQLEGTNAVATTRSGTDVYVMSSGNVEGSAWGVVNHFRRTSTGGLAFAGCIGEFVRGCSPIGSSATVSWGQDIAVTADGTSVYVASNSAGSVTHFRRDAATGNLRYAGCVGQPAFGDNLTGCTPPGTTAMHGVDRLVISPNDDSLYVSGGSGSGSVVHLRRNTVTGDIRFDGCVGGGAGCAPITPTIGNGRVAITPDGAGVYVTSSGPESGMVIHLRRSTATGALTYISCLGENTHGQCGEIPGHALLLQSSSIVAAPGSRAVYVTSGGFTGAIVRFQRWV